MKAATIHQLKKELSELTPKQLLEICLRMAKFKKDNKELLTYLLFEAQDEPEYIALIKTTIDDQLNSINDGNLCFLKKGLRKIIRQVDKYLRYSGNKETEVEVRLYFCQRINEMGVPVKSIKSFITIYQGQLKKINTALSKLHEDVQYEYQLELEKLQ